jgi:hypothetical protein
MKTHTQQQTSLEIETTATEPKLSRQKRSEYKPKKWRGNTLVPVIIALAISAIATVAFLNQGANLASDNKIIISQNEIVAIQGEYTLVAFRKTAKNLEAKDLPYIHDGTNYRSNVFGKVYTFKKATDSNPAEITYGTDSGTTCNELKAVVDRLSGLSANCDNDGKMTIKLD